MFFNNDMVTAEINTLFLQVPLSIQVSSSAVVVENEKIRPILARLDRLLLLERSPTTNDSDNKTRVGRKKLA